MTYRPHHDPNGQIHVPQRVPRMGSMSTQDRFYLLVMRKLGCYHLDTWFFQAHHRHISKNVHVKDCYIDAEPDVSKKQTGLLWSDPVRIGH